MNYTYSHLPIDSTRNSFDLPGITDTRRVKTIPCEINILRDNYANSCSIRANARLGGAQNDHLFTQDRQISRPDPNDIEYLLLVIPGGEDDI